MDFIKTLFRESLLRRNIVRENKKTASTRKGKRLIKNLYTATISGNDRQSVMKDEMRERERENVGIDSGNKVNERYSQLIGERTKERETSLNGESQKRVTLGSA